MEVLLHFVQLLSFVLWKRERDLGVWGGEGGICVGINTCKDWGVPTLDS